MLHCFPSEFLAACYSWQESELNVIWTAFQKMDTVWRCGFYTKQFIVAVSGGVSERGQLTYSVALFCRMVMVRYQSRNLRQFLAGRTTAWYQKKRSSLS